MCAICNFRIEFDVGHPYSLSVAVSTRAAIEAGVLPEQPADGALAHAKRRMVAIETLRQFQNGLESSVSPDTLLALPDFYVFMIESGTWGFFHATASGFDPEIEPDMPNVTAASQSDRDVVLICAQAALQALMEGRFGVAQAFADNLFMLDASQPDRQAIMAVMEKSFVPTGSRPALVS